MLRLRLTLLGSPGLTDEAGNPVPGLGPGKPLGMLAYLVFQKTARRDELIALLWGDVIESKARNAFRQTLHRLRASLGGVLTSEQDLIVLRDEQAIWCDAIAFQQAVADGDVERAVQLYRGAFLDGLDLGEEAFADWADEQRHRLASAYEGALARAAEDALERGDWQTAAERARLLAAASPHNGDAAVLEATALLAGGRRAEAVSALTLYARRMEVDLGSKPTEAARSMLQAILSSPAAAEKGRAPSLGDSRFRKPEFTGREKELARLMALWRNAASGEGRSCVVYGELGIGKSRLVAEFVLRTPSIAAPLLLQGHEREAIVTMPYASIAEALRPALNAPGLAGASQHLLAEAARLLPELRDQFDLPEPQPLGDDAERVRFYEGIAALIDAVSYEQPVCMVLEDLHHATGSTLELVRYLSRRLRASAVMIVATWEKVDGSVAAGRERASLEGGGDSQAAEARRLFDQFEELPLASLSSGESERMLTDLLQRAGVTQQDVARLIGLSSGSPLRLTELAEQASGGEVPAALPTTIRDVLWRRLQECAPHEQRLFVAASLFSQAVGIRLLAAASHVSEAAALEGVLSLERRGLLSQRDGRLAPASPAAAELAIETTGAAGVSLLAGWAADALAAEPSPAPGELARLYALADRRPAAYRHARAAALAAAACGARQETERFLSLAASAASNETERSEISALSVALGQTGQRLLPGSGGTEPTEVVDDEVAAPGDTAPSGEPSRIRPRGRIQQAVWASRWVIMTAAIGIAAIFVARSAVGDRVVTRGNALVDTLVLVERLGSREQRFYVATGLLTNEVSPARGLRVPANAPPWVDSLSLPWINPRMSPDGRMLAVERVTPSGVDLYVFDAATRETRPIAVDGGDHIIEGWSPDGAHLLVVVGRTSRAGTYDSDLYVYPIAPGSPPVAIDTTSERSVVSARWSPRGTHVAWVARDGQTRQQEVFVAWPDGSRARNLSRHPAEDFDLAWAADGELLAFTSERDGNAEIYSAEVSTGALRRMTFHQAQDSRPSFSPDGQFLAFESARQGRIETYVMPSFAGAPRRILSDERSLEILEWRGAAPPFVETVAIRTNVSIAPGDSAVAVAEALDQYGNATNPGFARWSSLDPAIVEVRPIAGSPDRIMLLAERQGSARITVDAGGWRSDTVLVHASPMGVAALREDFETPSLSRFWTSLGSPAPFVRASAGRGRTRGLVLNGDAQWESGVLGAQFLTLRPGLSVQLWLSAPFTTYGQLGREVSIALVAPDARTSIDSVSPQFLKLVSVSWLGDAARFRYAVEREFRTEPAGLLGNANQHLIRLTVEPSGRAAFYVDGSLRWRSSILATPPDGLRRVQLWIGSRATGQLAVVDDVEVSP